MFASIKRGPPDPMNELKRRADGDVSADKVDLGVGIYRNEDRVCHQLECVRQAKVQLAKDDPGHDYEVTIGNAKFLNHASKLLFGDSCNRLLSKQIASVQTISGTGAVHLAAQLLAQCVSPLPTVYVGVPAWGNYKPIFELVGHKVVEYPYYDPVRRTIDFASIIQAVKTAPPGSIFILQACCHNPTGADPTQSQWQEIAGALKEGSHLPILDIAYQGLGNGLDEDAYPVRLFNELGFDTLVCQSFAKNFGLYGERCGALHAVCTDSQTAENVQDRLRCLIRWEFSSSPAYGSRLVNIVLDSAELSGAWRSELLGIQGRLKGLRQQLHSLLTEKLQTPGDWGSIILETGLFSYLKLSPAQCETLAAEHHVYVGPNGRINVSGLNQANVDIVGTAIDQVFRAAQ